MAGSESMLVFNFIKTTTTTISPKTNKKNENHEFPKQLYHFIFLPAKCKYFSYYTFNTWVNSLFLTI